MKGETGDSATQQWRKIDMHSSVLSKVHDLYISFVMMGILWSYIE